MGNILVVGGAGYIGSHVVRCLLDVGHRPIVLDNLSAGVERSVAQVDFVQGDCGDAALLQQVFSSYAIDAVIHLASFINVGESVTHPAMYYKNNVAKTITLLNAMVRHSVDVFIFSSSAAIFGDPKTIPITESHAMQPLNPYGRTKLMVEQMLVDYHHAYSMRYGCLRYFNAAGAMPDASLGEMHEPETHLIPLILQVASGRRAEIAVFGTDYDTPDGTCVRDYVHVCDVAEAHVLMLRALQSGKLHVGHFNIGIGKGYSVYEVINAVRRITGQEIAVRRCARRAGDPAQLIADGTAARKQLAWKPRYTELDMMVLHAWQWEKVLAGEASSSVSASRIFGV
jgi:UDP-glucose 4-epimerase